MSESIKLDDMPFEKVQELYYERKRIEATNDIKQRTRLRKKYPELFQTKKWEELETIFAKAEQLSNRND